MVFFRSAASDAFFTNNQVAQPLCKQSTSVFYSFSSYTINTHTYIFKHSHRTCKSLFISFPWIFLFTTFISTAFYKILLLFPCCSNIQLLPILCNLMDMICHDCLLVTAGVFEGAWLCHQWEYRATWPSVRLLFSCFWFFNLQVVHQGL